MKTVYIIGDDALAYFLATQIINNGNRAILLSANLPTNEIVFSLKTPKGLFKKKYQIPVQKLPSEPASLIILTAYGPNIGYVLSVLRTSDTPVLTINLPSPISNIGIGNENNLYQGFGNAFINLENNLLNLFGRTPELVICPPQNIDNPIDIATLLASKDLTVTVNNEPLTDFWRFFAPYALASLISCAEPDNNLPKIRDNSANREKLKQLTAEMIRLAQSAGAKLGDDDIIRTLQNIPSNYVYPLRNKLSNIQKDEFIFISSVLFKAKTTDFVATPIIDRLLKQIGNTILQFDVSASQPQHDKDCC